jgi:hydroxyethylthiazole kinase
MKSCYQSIIDSNLLILNLTNQVSMQWVANVELAIHASPIMSTNPSEFEDILDHASALYINIGTLNDDFIHQALQASTIAQEKKIPIILDPVGCGFTSPRTSASLALLECATVVRGNASEVIALGSQVSLAHGIDSIHTTDEAKIFAAKLAKLYDCVVVVTGEKDFICSAQEEFHGIFGSRLMRHITGMGCALGGVIAAFLAVCDNTYQACVSAVLFYTLSASLIAKTCSLGEFSSSMINALYNPNWKSLESMMRGNDS